MYNIDERAKMDGTGFETNWIQCVALLKKSPPPQPRVNGGERRGIIIYRGLWLNQSIENLVN